MYKSSAHFPYCNPQIYKYPREIVDVAVLHFQVSTITTNDKTGSVIIDTAISDPGSTSIIQKVCITDHNIKGGVLSLTMPASVLEDFHYNANNIFAAKSASEKDKSMNNSHLLKSDSAIKLLKHIRPLFSPRLYSRISGTI